MGFNSVNRKYFYSAIFVLLGIYAILGGCYAADVGNMYPDPVPSIPAVVSMAPPPAAVNIFVKTVVTTAFNKEMDPASITSNFTLAQGETAVTGAVTYSAPYRTATFTPAADLDVETEYTATVTTGAKDLDGNPLAAPKTWTFTTAPPGIGPASVDLGTAAHYAVLAKSDISTLSPSAITGDIGLSPAAASAITGFAPVMDGTGTFAASAQVSGAIFAADMLSPTPAQLTAALADMELAYSDAAARIQNAVPDLGAGEIGGLVIVPGLYKFTTSVSIASDVTLFGGPDSIWIFRIPGTLASADGVRIILAGGAEAKNIFWQVDAGAVLGMNSRFTGNILSQTHITLGAGAALNGRLLAGTSVNLNANTITRP